MAEDQGVNGDLWNDQASKLLAALKWEPIGDSNMDLPNIEGGVHGVDRLYKYLESLKTNTFEGVLVEAKRYSTTSFSSGTIDTWVKTLDTKLSNLKNSPELHEKFPDMADIPLRTGLIVIWFHNVHEYVEYKTKFKNYASTIKLSRKNVASNKIYILENDLILKLASLCISVKSLNESINNRLQFYYPSVDSYPAKRSEILNPNYMISKFILADFIDNDNIENKVVFYFGRLDLGGFLRLKSALSNNSYIDNDKPLIIYTYQRDDEGFRKIRPEVEKLFKKTIQLKEMELFSDLPTFMRT